MIAASTAATVSLATKTIAASKATTRVAIAATINLATTETATIPATTPVKRTAAASKKIYAIKGICNNKGAANEAKKGNNDW